MKLSVFKKRLLLVVLALVVIQLVSVVVLVGGLKNVDRVIAEDIVITSQWREIKLQRPLPASQRPQLISLDLNEALAVPEMQLVDEYGYAYDLHAGTVTYAGNSVVIAFDLGKDFSVTKDPKYGIVRIRSNSRVQCNKIVWHYRM